MKKIQMVDLKSQYQKIKLQVDTAIQEVIDQAAFINGKAVKDFAQELGAYLGEGVHVVPCANGTDALQIALMALGLIPGDEVIVPCFTYVATAEVIALLGLKPVMVDVCPQSFNITADVIEKAITSKTKAIVPVHLYGQCADMEAILQVAHKYQLFVVEDTAQAIGADYTFKDGSIMKAGTMGDIGCTSFFPSKNLGCYGDGGALYTRNDTLAKRIEMIANHGQEKKYYHAVIGVNSRLDTLQAAILRCKLPYLDTYAIARRAVAESYHEAFAQLDWLETPFEALNSTHVYHQYTIKLSPTVDRERLRQHLTNAGVPSMIYYPMPLHLQKAFKQPNLKEGDFPISEDLCKHVLSLPIHTEMETNQLSHIIQTLRSFSV